MARLTDLAADVLIRLGRRLSAKLASREQHESDNPKQDQYRYLI